MIANTVSKLETREFAPVDNTMAAARRKLDAAIELLHAFDPSASALEQAAIAIAKVAHKAMKESAE